MKVVDLSDDRDGGEELLGGRPAGLSCVTRR